MGMDVSGKNPDAEVGVYFRRNVWGWRRLADYCRNALPEYANTVSWHSNDGEGLDKTQSLRLAAILMEDVASGAAADKIAAEQAILDNAPDEPCWLCKGTGERHDEVVQGTCNACGGKGSVRPWATHYRLDVEDLKEFAEFLQHCGGFAIY